MARREADPRDSARPLCVDPKATQEAALGGAGSY
jgi:hypothetical protein